LLLTIAIALSLMFFMGSLVVAVEESGGIGMKVTPLYNYTTSKEDKRGSIVVLDVFKGSPAQKHGIQKGDIILKINDQITREQDFEYLLHNHLRGPSFTDVKLEIWRPSIQEKFTLEIQRTPMVY